MGWLCFLPYICPYPRPKDILLHDICILVLRHEFSLLLETLSHLRGSLEYVIDELWPRFDDQTLQFSAAIDTGSRKAFGDAISLLTKFFAFATTLDSRVASLEQRLSSTFEDIEGFE